MATFTLLYLNNNKKCLLSEPNPKYKGSGELTTRKELINLPPDELMSRMITTFKSNINQAS